MRSLTGLVVIALFAGVVACAGSADDPTDRTWQLTELEGAPPVEATTVDMTITEGDVSGTAGCNGYSGSASVDTESNSMTLGPEFDVTFMACADDVMAQEQGYLEALTRVTSYEMANDTLTLLDANSIAVATFE